MLRNNKNYARLWFVTLCMAILVGCRNNGDRPDLGLVEGTVRLDGQPLPDIRVVFKKPGARAAVGATDANGHYYLVYLRDIKGAAVGEHTVSLFDMNKPENQPGSGRIPARYSPGAQDAEPLIKTVEAGGQTINFDLTSMKTRPSNP